GGIAIVTVNFCIDTVLPYFVFDYVPEVTNKTNLTLTGNSEPYSKIICGTNYTYARNDGKFALEVQLAEGTNIRNVTSVDAAGNTYLREIRIHVDTRPPILHVQPLPKYSITREITVSGHAENGAIVTVNDANAELFSGDFSLIVHLNEGLNKIVVSATDAAGNRNSAYFQVIYDPKPPFLTVVAESTIVRDNFVNISGRTEIGAKVTVKGENIEVEPDGSFKTAVGGLDPGINSFIVRAEDEAGNVREINIKVFRDSVCELVIILPQNNSKTIFENVQIFGLGEPGSNVTINNIKVNVGKDGTFYMSIPLSIGDNYFAIKGVDKLGNTASYYLHIVREGRSDTTSNENELKKLVIPIGIVLAGLLAAILIVLYAPPTNYYSNYPKPRYRWEIQNTNVSYSNPSIQTYTSPTYPTFSYEGCLQSPEMSIKSNKQFQTQAEQSIIPIRTTVPTCLTTPGHDLSVQPSNEIQNIVPTFPSVSMQSQLQHFEQIGEEQNNLQSENLSQLVKNEKEFLKGSREQKSDENKVYEDKVCEKKENVMQIEELKVDISSVPEIKLEIKPEPGNTEIPLEIKKLEHVDSEHENEQENEKMEISISDVDLNKKVEDEINESEKEVNRIKGLGIEVGQSQTLLRLAKALLRSKNYDKASQYAKKATNIALELELRAKLNDK
ncbi:MAG: hypothetical protein QXT63_09365, partial [Thermoplasmata archaeon]